jgi:hypothetical protein
VWHQGVCQVSEPTLLDLDHVNGGGSQWKKNPGHVGNRLLYLQSLLDMVEIEEVQLLCANCHRAKDYDRMVTSADAH